MPRYYRRRFNYRRRPYYRRRTYSSNRRFGRRGYKSSYYTYLTPEQRMQLRESRRALFDSARTQKAIEAYNRRQTRYNLLPDDVKQAVGNQYGDSSLRKLINRIQGRGGYWRDLGRRALASGAEWGAGFVGNELGLEGRAWERFRDGGRFVGEWAGRKLLGKGAYVGPTTNGNNLMLDSGPPRTPIIQSCGDETGAIIVSYTEYVNDVFAPASAEQFSCRQIPINPGLSVQFANWISGLANNYELWEPLQCVFSFRSGLTDYSSNQNVGFVLMTHQPNPNEPNFSFKQEMLDYNDCTSKVATEDCVYGIECDITKRKGNYTFYTRPGQIPAGQDPNEYDLGKFCVATYGLNPALANKSIGELWVTYTFKLMHTQNDVTYGKTILCDSIYNTAGVQTQYLLGSLNTATMSSNNNIGLQISYPVSNRTVVSFPLSFQSGYYRATYWCIDGTFANAVITFVFANSTDAPLAGKLYNTAAFIDNSSQPATLDNPGMAGVFPGQWSAASTTGFCGTCCFQITQNYTKGSAGGDPTPGQKASFAIAWNSGTMTAPPTKVFLRVEQFNPLNTVAYNYIPFAQGPNY